MEYPFEAMDELQFHSLCLSQQDLQLYAVIEGAKAPEGYQTTGALIYTLDQQPVAHPLLISSTNNDLLDVSPWLVAVKPDGLLYSWLLENASTHPFILFWSRATLPTLIPYMSNLLTVDSLNGTPLYFRYYDPTVLSVLIRYGSDETMASRVGPVRGLAAFSGCQGVLPDPCWRVRWFETTESEAADNPPTVTLNPSEWQAMGELRRTVNIKQMMAYLGTHYPDHLLNVDSPTLHKFVTLSIEKGDLYGFKTQGELEQWLDLQLYFGSGFEEETQYSWAKPILDSQHLTPSEKLQKLNLYLDQYQARSA